jgi:hypothetical protein
MVALRWEQQQYDHDDADDIFANEWRMLAEQRPAQERTRAVVKAAPAAARATRKASAVEADFDDRADIDYRPVVYRSDVEDRKPAGQVGSFVKRTAIGLSAVLLMAGGGWVLFHSGPIKLPKFQFLSRPGASASVSDLPAVVASVPAVTALQRNDPAAFERFKKRYADAAATVRKDDGMEMTLARNALRKSVKHLLAIAPGDVLLDLTEASLGYLQGLQTTNPEMCVWLSDETKGARLTSNLAKDLPLPFMREMSVLERVASTNPHFAIAPISNEEAQPYFGRVVGALRQQNVNIDLQGRKRLESSEFAPYCSLVIAFYKAVLELPRDDRINVLRKLYADAAVNADSDLVAAK